MAGIREKRIKIVEKIVILVVIAGIFATFMPTHTANAASGSSAICIEQSSLRVLHGENIHARLPMASTTKIMTAYAVILATPDLDRVVEIPKEAVGVEGSSIYLRVGDKLTVRELLYGLMLRSGNDAAVALAVATSGSVAEFVALMNETAKSIGAVNTNFCNPHGLHDGNHYTTAYDLALITARAMDSDVFKQIVGCKFITVGEGEAARYFQNKNKMLYNFEGANGVKTGYTVAAGRCLVAAAEHGGMQLISVVLNRGAMWQECGSMMDSGFTRYKMRPLYKTEESLVAVPVEGGNRERVICTPDRSPMYPLTDEEFSTLRFEYELLEKPTAPVEFNKNIGNLRVYSGEHLLFVSNLITMQSVEKLGAFGR